MTAGILTKHEIIDLITSGKLVANGDIARAQGCSYDMVVGTVFDNGQITRLHEDPARQIIVPAGGIISLFTAEELQLPNNIAGLAFAINEMSSRGFLVLNPGHVDPGFSGPLTVKAVNLRKSPLVLQAGEPVFTVVFFRLSQDTETYRTADKRSDMERKFNRTDIEVSPRSLADAYEASGSGKFPTIDQVDRLIARHWTSWISMGLAFIGAIAAIVAAVAAVAVIKGGMPQSSFGIAEPILQQPPQEMSPPERPTKGSNASPPADADKPQDVVRQKASSANSN